MNYRCGRKHISLTNRWFRSGRSFLTEAKLGCNATLAEIFEAMRHPVTGVSFVARAQSLPSCTFVLWDAINWLNAHVEGTVNALDRLEAMRK